MAVIEIHDLDDQRLAPYASLTEAQLRNRLNPADALIIVESPKVIRVALDAGYVPVSMLTEARHISGDAADIVARFPDMPIYTGSREVLSRLTGYTLTRGVLCAMRRPAPLPVESVCRHARRLAVIHGVVDTTNIGAIFRSAAALGVDGVLLTTDSCDPLNRRSIRVSMGSVFLVPWTWLDDRVSSLHTYGFTTVAMALTNDCVSIDDPRLVNADKLAIVLGTEGDGLPAHVIAETDFVAKIPMSHNVDSLNVAAASAIAFWATR